MAYDWSRLTNTDQSSRSNGVKIVVYGQAGAGKTVLSSTCTPAEPHKTLLISAESGTLSLRGIGMPEAPVKTWEEFKGIYSDIAAGVAAGALPYEWIAIDSISEIVEKCLEVKMQAHKGDTWAVYREMGAEVVSMIKKWRDLEGINVYMSCKQEREKSDTGLMLYQPSLPGKKSVLDLMHAYDEIFAYRLERDAQGNVRRFLQTQPCHQYQAKDRSDRLEFYEAPDLGAIYRKIMA